MKFEIQIKWNLKQKVMDKKFGTFWHAIKILSKKLSHFKTVIENGNGTTCTRKIGQILNYTCLSLHC